MSGFLLARHHSRLLQHGLRRRRASRTAAVSHRLFVYEPLSFILISSPLPLLFLLIFLSLLFFPTPVRSVYSSLSRLAPSSAVRFSFLPFSTFFISIFSVYLPARNGMSMAVLPVLQRGTIPLNRNHIRCYAKNPTLQSIYFFCPSRPAKNYFFLIINVLFLLTFY